MVALALVDGASSFPLPLHVRARDAVQSQRTGKQEVKSVNLVEAYSLACSRLW